MSASAPASRHLVRWTVLAILVVLAALIAGLAIYVHSLLQPERFTSLLARNLASVGLELEIEEPAEPALFPRPAVQLPSFSLTNTGSDIPVLKASGATIVVPWRTLWSGEIAIERIDVDAPRIDLGELKETLARLPRRTGPPRLPAITTGVHMHHGVLTDDGSPILFDFGLDTGALIPGKPFRMDASGRTAAGRQLVAHLGTVPTAPHDGTIDFRNIELTVAGQAGTALELAGRAHWRGGPDLAMQLTGTFRHRGFAPAASPTAAEPAASAALASNAPAANGANGMVSAKVAIAVTPPTGQTPIQVSVKLDGPATSVDMRMQPTEFDSWWQRVLSASSAQPPGPLPFTGTAHIQRIDLGWLKATGLSMVADPDLKPAPGASVAPATSASPGPR